MVVDEETARALRTGNRRLAWIFAASCAERLAQAFCTFRAIDLSRSEDIAYVVDTLESLWDPEHPASSFNERREHLLSFPELRPNDIGFTQVSDIYCFYSCLVLMYATKCAATGGDPEAAVSCAHASLTAMGQLDQNLAEARNFSNERARQKTTIDSIVNGASLSQIRDDDRTAAQELVATIQNRINRD